MEADSETAIPEEEQANPSLSETPQDASTISSVPSSNLPINMPLKTPKAPLICGILSLVFIALGWPLIAWGLAMGAVVVVAPILILGIAAIVLAHQYYKQGGKAKSPRVGMVAGIISVGAVAFVFLICCTLVVMGIISGASSLNDPSNSSVRSITSTLDEGYAPSGSTKSLDDEAVKADIDPYLNRITEVDPETQEKIERVLSDSFRNLMIEYNLTYSMEDCGIDKAELAKSLMEEFEFGFDEAIMVNGNPRASYYMYRKNPSYIVSSFRGSLTDLAPQINSGAISVEEGAALVGEALMEAYADTKIESGLFSIAIEENGGQWVIDDYQWGVTLRYLFAISSDKTEYVNTM